MMDIVAQYLKLVRHMQDIVKNHSSIELSLNEFHP